MCVCVCVCVWVCVSVDTVKAPTTLRLLCLLMKAKRTDLAHSQVAECDATEEKTDCFFHWKTHFHSPSLSLAFTHQVYLSLRDQKCVTIVQTKEPDGGTVRRVMIRVITESNSSFVRLFLFYFFQRCCVLIYLVRFILTCNFISPLVFVLFSLPCDCPD